MGKDSGVFVAFDIAEQKHAIAIAEGGRTGEVRFMGDVENNPAPIERTIKRPANRYERPHVCFEAGPTGYGLYRQVQALGHDCMVVARALIPKRAGERIKTKGAGASVRSLSPPQRHGQKAARRRGGDRRRNGRFPVGHRTGSRAPVNTMLSRCRPGSGARKVGELPSLVMWPSFVPDARPLEPSSFGFTRILRCSRRRRIVRAGIERGWLRLRWRQRRRFGLRPFAAKS